MKKIEKQSIQNYLSLIRGNFKKYVGFIFLTAIEIGLNVVQPIIFGKLIFELTNKNLDVCFKLLVILTMLKGGELIFKSLNFYIIHFLRNNINRDIRWTLIKKVEKYKLKEKYTVGQIKERLTEVAGLTRKMDEFIIMLTKVGKILIILYFIARINKLLMALISISIILYYVVYSIFGEKIKIHVKNTKKTNERFDNIIYKWFSTKEDENEEMKQTLNEYRDVRLTYNEKYNIINIVGGFTEIFSEFALIVCAIYMYSVNKIGFDSLITFITYEKTLKITLKSIMTFKIDIEQLLVSFVRVNEILVTDNQIETEGAYERA